MNLKWYANRLRSMEPAEVLHRVGEKARKSISRRYRDGWRHYSPPALSRVFADLPAKVAAASVEQREAVAAAARKILSGQFSALGRDWPQRQPGTLFPDDLWSGDPVTGRSWPAAETYTFDIEYRHDGSRGDIKYAWEIGRLQILPVLATHYLLTGEDGALTAIEEAIESWHRANPPFTGIGWASGIEVALRAISLVLTRDLLSSKLGEATERRIGEILAASFYWLKRFPSKFSSANNHLIAELAGDYLIGLSLAAGIEQTEHELLSELLKQILPDGSGAEQTPTYAAFSVELVLFCLLARGRDQALPVEVQDRLAAFSDFAAWLPKHMTFGDDDEGRVLTLGQESDYVGSIGAAISGFLAQPGLGSPTNDFRQIFFGQPSHALTPPRGLHVFAQGGLSIWRGNLRERSVDLLFDHGPLGYLSIAAHGHADALSLALAIDGRPVMVDPGTWLYGSGGVWRDWFRSTPAHNTLNIDGESQSLMSGAFNWSHKARTHLLENQSEPEWTLTAEHDGYLRRFGARHRRTVRRRGEDIVISDRLLGTFRQAQVVFQLAPGLLAEVDGNRLHVRRGDELLLTLTFPDDHISVAAGGADPGEGGWVSPRFGVRTEALRVVWQGQVGEDDVDTIVSVQPRHVSLGPADV